MNSFPKLNKNTKIAIKMKLKKYMCQVMYQLKGQKNIIGVLAGDRIKNVKTCNHDIITFSDNKSSNMEHASYNIINNRKIL